jgi:hypothetical protein
MSDNSSTKKRKANDSRVTASDDTYHEQIDDDGCDDHQSPSARSCSGNLSQQMDTMMQIMLRMEEKCNRLEANVIHLKIF